MLISNPLNTAATQWLERSLDDSANRRLVLEDSFLTADAVLLLAAHIASGLTVREATVAAREQRVADGVRVGVCPDLHLVPLAADVQAAFEALRVDLRAQRAQQVVFRQRQ